MSQSDSSPVDDVAGRTAVDAAAGRASTVSDAHVDTATGQPEWLADAIVLLVRLTAAAPTLFLAAGAVGVLVGVATMVHGGAALTVVGAVLVIASVTGPYVAIVVTLYVRIRLAALLPPASSPLPRLLPPPTGASRSSAP